MKHLIISGAAILRRPLSCLINDSKRRRARVTKELVEFTGLDKKTVIHKMRTGTREVAREFVQASPKGGRQLLDFYKNTYTYIFDRSNWECISRERVDGRIASTAFGKVLDFGGRWWGYYQVSRKKAKRGLC